MDTKTSTIEDLLVLGGALLVFFAIVQGSTAGGMPTPSAPTPSEPIPSAPRPGAPKSIFIPLHPPSRYVE